MEAPDSSETSVLTRATRRNNPEDTILHSHRRENLKSYMFCYVLHLHYVTPWTAYQLQYLIYEFNYIRRMLSSGMLRRAALVSTEFSEERIARCLGC
jgi:hypothetical protein